ncbi:helix-turn-helix transcriptional regulator [Massilia yuzhufengensis]|uniref:Transcriptional regulator, LuxR family n=1 Tax=Massilia yuzhufengensis TaxID=1164594 RepID=A0A1I1QNG2_9BURK|nr:LuxR family transcriptional regulator [Massilia yuzhufengensis]SFD20823.1 transcriptional regulator, LuxR family [Massilia yuzhufengensis]
MIDTALLLELMEAKDDLRWSECLFRLARSQGFEQTLFGVVPSRHVRFENAFTRSNYSSEWRSRYDANGFAYVDPTVGHCVTSTLPLVWAPSTFATGAPGALYEEASAHGIRSGVTLPVHGPNGELGMISFASDARPGIPFERSIMEVLPALSLVRDYAFASSAGLRDARPDPVLPRLTRREREVLQWVMVGKSSWEVARITNCSEATINFHLANVRQKFGVNTRQQAVVKAIALGLITPEDHHR